MSRSRSASSERAVVSPNDLVEARSPKVRRVTVGGRVAGVSSTRIRLADAFDAIDVSLASPGELRVGDLAVFSGTWTGKDVVRARLLELHAAEQSAPTGEFARLAWTGTGQRLRRRAVALAAIRRFFAARRFVEVDTPVRARTPGADSHVEGIRAGRRWLITSPEFHMKRLLVGGMPRIYQLVHCTRADEAGPLHEPEFLMLEWYRGFSGQGAVMRDTEQLVATVARAISGGPSLRSQNGRRIDATPPYPRLTVSEAFRRHAGVADAADLAARDEDRFFQLLVDRVEPALAARRTPVFLCEYPISQASLARPAPHDATVAERFELYAGGVELCNGFGELTDPREQKRRFAQERKRRRRQGRPAYPVDDRFLDSLREGMPPAGGNALGVDRLVALACGVATIAEVQAFPFCRT